MQQSVDAHTMQGMQPTANPIGWLRGPAFDITLIFGAALLAIGSGLVILGYPSAFPLLLFLDLWFLGYHHVVATFTRLTFDLESFKQHRFLIVWVPIILVAVLVPLVLMIGPWVLATMYLYWQWFHYTRQSYGISRIYLRKSSAEPPKRSLLDEGVIYLPPVLGILHRSWQNPGLFLGMELRVIPVALPVLQAAAVVTAGVVGYWLILQLVAWQQGRLKPAYALYMLSHIAVFSVGYLFISEINYGWLVVNIWHNMQYVLIVWMYNNNRFRKGVEPRHKFLSTLSQSRNMVLYFVVCVLLATAVYKSIDAVIGLFAVATLPLAIIAYQTINFHHYIVDSVLWKIRKASVSQRLGIPG